MGSNTVLDPIEFHGMGSQYFFKYLVLCSTEEESHTGVNYLNFCFK